MTRDGIVNPGTLGPVATRVVDGSTFAVVVDLEPVAPLLIRDICRAIAQAHVTGALHYIGTHTPDHWDYAEQLGIVTDALTTRGALTVQLHPAAAERLSGELWDAKDEPPLTCACGDYTDNADSVCDLCREPGSYARRRAL